MGERYGVSAWIPSRELADAAGDRVEGMVAYFLTNARRYSPCDWQNDLYTLARSCYLQGAADTAMIAARILVERNVGQRQQVKQNPDENDQAYDSPEDVQPRLGDG
jgi:hypothetical protein